MNRKVKLVSLAGIIALAAFLWPLPVASHSIDVNYGPSYTYQPCPKDPSAECLVIGPDLHASETRPLFVSNMVGVFIDWGAVIIIGFYSIPFLFLAGLVLERKHE